MTDGESGRGVIGWSMRSGAGEPAFWELQVAPFRRGFIVERDDPGQLLSAMLGAATIWGGARCPILPIECDGSMAPGWMQVVSAIDPAALVDFTGGGKGKSAWAGVKTSRWPVLPARPLDDGGFWNLHPISALQPEELSNLTLFLPTDTTLLNAASAGCLKVAEEVDWWRQESYGVLETNDPVQLAKAQLGGHTVLTATAIHDTDSNAPLAWNTMALLWLTSDAENPDEIIRWWNTRALRPRPWQEAVSILTTPEAVENPRFADDLRLVVRHRVFTRPDLVITSQSIAPDRLHGIAAELGFSRHSTGNVTDSLPVGSPPDIDRQLTYMVGQDLHTVWGGQRTSGTTGIAAVMVQRPTTRIRQASPLRWNSGLYGTGRVSLRVSGQAITGPRLDTVARQYHGHARWHHDRLEMPQTAAPIYDFQLHIPEPDEILSAACAARNVTYLPSDKARQVHGVWALAQDPAMFRDRAVINVTKVLTPESSRELIKTLNASAGFDETQKEEIRVLAAANRVTMKTLKEIASHNICKSLSREAIAVALQQLVACGMAIRGLRADCSVCPVRHLYALDEAAPRPRCPGCGAEATYAVEHGTGEPALFYRINTLVQMLSLNGGLAPLAAISLLAGEGAFAIPGANIYISGEQAGELDLLGWRDDTLFAGEAKMSARQLAASDHDKDVAKSAAVGATEHLAVCLEAIPDKTRQALQSSCVKAGIALVILDASELLLPKSS